VRGHAVHQRRGTGGRGKPLADDGGDRPSSVSPDHIGRDAGAWLNRARDRDTQRVEDGPLRLRYRLGR
jgi:hypothetical protein